MLDLSRVLAGPWATQLLGDLGAEIIKIERPGEGDDTRHWGPPFTPDGMSAYFMSANRGKRSVALDISTKAGQEIIRLLASVSDVLVENFRVGGLRAYGLDDASLRAINPRLVYCSITGFGQTGPDRARAGYDFMIQGMGGLMSLTGDLTGEPQKVGVAMVDILTGLYAANAIQAAMIERTRTGLGATIDLALFDVQLATLANQAMNYLIGGAMPTRLGNAHPNIVPYQSFATADGFVIVAVGNDAQFARYAAVCGEPALAVDARFAKNADRVRNRTALVPRLDALMITRSTAEWVAALEAVGVPCGPVNTVAEAFAEPQAAARGMVVESAGVRSVASPLRRSDVRPVWPRLGEHTDEVLREVLELDEAAIGLLRDAGAFG